MRYAIVASGGKQYVAREGETVEIDLVPVGEGQGFEFPEVLLAADGEQVLVGAPTVDGARVAGTILGTIRGKKVIIFRYQPKKRRRRKAGHRQSYTRVLIEQIEAPGLGRSAGGEAQKAAAPRRKKPAAKSAGASAASEAGPRKTAVKKTVKKTVKKAVKKAASPKKD